MTKVNIDALAVACKDVIKKELKKQFASVYSDDFEKVTNKHYKRRELREGSVSQPSYEKIFPKKDSASVIFSQPEKLKERQLSNWRQFNNAKIQLLNRGLGPRNIIEEQIEWTKKGKMWPYPIDNEYLLGQEENTSFVDHVFLEQELLKYKLPRSVAIDHYMELVLTGLSKNPYMSVEKKHEHIRWFADYFKSSAEGKYKELL